MINPPAIVIPAYQPNERLITLVHGLRHQRPEQEIIIVDDGSDREKKKFFHALQEYQVQLLEHPKNYGKGQALKTAFNYYLQKTAQPIGVVTADADGQHSIKDILILSDRLSKATEILYLGVRDFKKIPGTKIPWRSQFGNWMTARLFHMISSIPVQDTQTGLRAIPSPLLQLVASSQSKAYEFEMEMLMIAAIHQIPIATIPIETIYFDNNTQSHFKPLLDSIKVYKVILKYFFQIVKK
ncbi:MAG: glycosyltransferase family 2 protein [Proteobacteria bacterium]|nr:glycosyltransferase family 2 protein [Pseudomonadota bacterium]